MRQEKKEFDPFKQPICRLEAVANGSVRNLKGQSKVFVGRDKTFALCDLIPCHQEGVTGGLWKVESLLLKRPDYYFLLANEIATRSYGRIIVSFKGQPLSQVAGEIIRRLGLRLDRQWAGASQELIAVEANPYNDTVMLRHCQVVKREENVYLREFYLPVVGTSTVMKIGYHTYNGDLSKLVAKELGSLANLANPVITALDRAHGR